MMSNMVEAAERINKLMQEKRDLQEKKKKLQEAARRKEAERKQRTRRLIAAGAAVESVIKRPCEGEVLEDVLTKLRASEADQMTGDELQRQALIGWIAEECLGRKFSAGDFAKFKSYLEAQQYRGNYYSRAMQ